MNETTTRECARRKAYPSDAAAQSIIFKIRAKGCLTDRMESYRCEGCGKWHLRRQTPPAIAPMPNSRSVRDVLPKDDE
jgi:hypothetical protein